MLILRIHITKENWAFCIKDILTTHGLMNIWINQFDIDIPFVIIKQRIIDTFVQKWYTDINNSSCLQTDF